MLSLKIFRQTKCSMFAAQRPISCNALSKCVNRLNVTSRMGNQIITKPLLTAPMIARFTGSAAAVKTGKNYASHWRTERIVSIALMGLFPASVLYSSQIVDTLLAASISLHVYWGLEALVVDYLRVPVVGQLANKAGHAAIALLAIITLAGFLQVIFVGDGLGNAIVTLWKL